jgi:CubicO group peptidase (beta-lactamase class C family)
MKSHAVGQSLLIAFAACTLCTASRAGAQVPAKSTLPGDAALTRRVDSIFAPYDAAGSPGCAVAVISAGRIRYERGFGLADVASGARITPASVFGLASLTKQFTAFSILLLAQDHRLSLDDDVRKWIPELPDYGVPMGQITIRRVLYHISGIPNYLAMLNTGWAITDPLTQHDVLEFLKDKPLDFASGSRYSYSNSGYVLLEMIVKRASGKSLREFAQARIFGPLKMTSTRPIPGLANAYISKSTTVPGDQRLVENGPEWQLANSRTDVVGDAGLYSTVEDLARWDANFYSGAVGGLALVRMMQRGGVLTSGDTVAYGAGLMLGAFRGLRTIGHIGGWSGYQTWLVRYPDQKFTLAILCNRRGFTPDRDPSHAIATIYLGKQMVVPEVALVVTEAFDHGGADSAVRAYHALRARYPAIAFEEDQLNALGYQLMATGRIEAAIVAFRLNVEAYPRSANTWDSLAEAYMNHGDKALAIENYERSLALNPENANAVKMLSKLRGP